MIRINLLPHRELERKARQQQIAVLAGVTFILGLIIVGVIHVAIIEQIEYQNGRNNYMKDQIIILDKQLEEINKSKVLIHALLAREKVIETLQDDRVEVVHLLDQLVRLLPDGVYLRSIKQTNHDINLTGYAQSSSRVSVLMRNLESSPWLESPSLIEIKAATVNNARLNEFNLDVKFTHSSENTDGKIPSADLAKPVEKPRN
ncbi:MAG: PilN domain-containing protein [Nitrosomonadaceae bacterium]|nr:PilN domain-containing protein [Nitrosomonadaceae bacterium]